MAADTAFAPPTTPPEPTAHLQKILQDLSRNPFPLVPCPAGVKKRASVALLIRVNPTYSHWPPAAAAAASPADLPSDDTSTRIAQFFAQDWARWGDPEVLFIKRSARKGDKWQGHVALPGGGLDPEDEDDRAAAVRETFEEVGVELSKENAIYVGNLPQRLVSGNWGKTMFMVLCPYVFLITNPALPPLRLQPTEIASAHWVPIRALLSPALRTWEHQDISASLARQETGLKRLLFRLALGRMTFTAIRLLPSESVHCSSAPNFAPDQSLSASSGVLQTCLDSLGAWRPKWLTSDPPLHLWGLTLGVLADVLDLFPPHNALTLWDLPTFSMWDHRLMIWIFAYRFRRRTEREMNSMRSANLPVPDAGGFNAAPASPTSRAMGRLAQTGSHEPWSIRVSQADNINRMLREYSLLVKRANQTTLAARGTLFALLMAYLWRRRRHF